MEGMDAKSAAKLATDTISSQWKITKADGTNRWMKYAPEAVYGNAAGSDWIKEQLEFDMSQIPGVTDGREVKKYLTVDPRTIKSPNKAYQVFTKNENGALEPYLTQTGEQAIFIPDYKESPSFKRLLEKFNGDNEQAMEHAIKLREAVSVKEQRRRLEKKRKLDKATAFKEKVEGFFDADN